MLAKQDLGPGSDIFEADLAFTPDEVLGRAAHIARGLVGEAREGVPSGFASTTPHRVPPTKSA